MAQVEAKATRNLAEACEAATSVRHCVLTSSLLTCVWPPEDSPGAHTTNAQPPTTPLIDHNSWSSESVCMNNKLWYALGKLRAEKAAREIAEGRGGFKLATICAGLVTGPDFHRRNPTSTIAYLKGAREMYDRGLLATVDVNRLAKAHVRVYEGMKAGMRSGEVRRHIYFDTKIVRQEELQNLASLTGLAVDSGRNPAMGSFTRYELSNSKLLSELMHPTFRCIDH